MADAILKLCCTCREKKRPDEFPKNRSEPDGLKKRCKGCNNKSNQDYRRRNPETSAASSRNWALKNPDRIREKQLRWAERHPGRQTELAKAWRHKYSERQSENARRYASLPHVRLQKTIRERIRQMLKGNKSRKTFALLGYGIEELKTHLERQFTKGMSWENFGEWHVDHIRPLSSFSITQESDPAMQEAWALSNLRPLWAQENLKKRAKCLYLV